MPHAIDVIVPVYRNPGLTRSSVESLLLHWDELAGRQARLLLIDDSPDDIETSTLLRNFAAGRADVQVLANERNLGFLHAANRGLDVSRAAGRDVLLVNSDTVTFPGTLRNLLLAAESDPQIGFASPRSNNASLCSLPHFFGGTIAGPDEAHARWKRLSAGMPAWHFAPTGVGFYMFIAHRVLKDHGGLRHDFGVGYEEENDLVMRAGRQGTRAILVNNAFAYHAGSASFMLTGLELPQHRHANHLRMVAEHPYFPTLVRRYEDSAHYRAERAMAGLLPDSGGRLRVCFDLTGLGQHRNGTNEHSVAVLCSLVPRWSDRLRVTAVMNEASFRFHGLDKVEGLERDEPGSGAMHGVAVRLSQPFDMHHINMLEQLAPVNLFAMLDTIAQDCAPLAAENDLQELWDHVAENADGLLFNSRFSEQQFLRRHPAAAVLPRLAMLLSTNPHEYRDPNRDGQSHGHEPRHILVLGNHFPHKASDAAARQLASAYPMLNIVVLAAETAQRGNVRSLRPGTLEDAQMRTLYEQASVVVLPSHIEGFGLGLMHALATGKPVAARRIPATVEILATFSSVQGVELFDSDPELPDAVGRALAAGRSRVGATSGPNWDHWADGLAELCLETANADRVFMRLVQRIRRGDLLRQAHAFRAGAFPAAPQAQAGAAVSSPPEAPPTDLAALLELNGTRFVEAAYRTVLQRDADSNGLAFYVAELESGGDKLDVLETLRKSIEGRARSTAVPGLDAALAARQANRRSIVSRLKRRIAARRD